jgi:thioredoxin 1
MKALALRAALALLLATFPIGCSRNGNEKSSSLARVRDLDQSTFDAEIREGVVLVDFWATWCGPCKMQAPAVEKVAAQAGDRAKITRLDIDKAPEVAKRFNIHAIPTLIVFKDGKLHKKFVGLTRAGTLASAIDSAADSK